MGLLSGLVSKLKKSILKTPQRFRSQITTMFRAPITNVLHRAGARIEKIGRFFSSVGYKTEAQKMKTDIDQIIKMHKVQPELESMHSDVPIPDYFMTQRRLNTPRKYWYVYKTDVYDNGKLTETGAYKSFWTDEKLSKKEAEEKLREVSRPNDYGRLRELDNIQLRVVFRNIRVK